MIVDETKDQSIVGDSWIHEYSGQRRPTLGCNNNKNKLCNKTINKKNVQAGLMHTQKGPIGLSLMGKMLMGAYKNPWLLQ